MWKAKHASLQQKQHRSYTIFINTNALVTWSLEIHGHIIPYGSNHLAKWWLGCIIASSERYLGSITILRRRVRIPKNIMTYCWWLKSCTTWDVWNPLNCGINYLSTGAGFLPSTVVAFFIYKRLLSRGHSGSRRGFSKRPPAFRRVWKKGAASEIRMEPNLNVYLAKWNNISHYFTNKDFPEIEDFPYYTTNLRWGRLRLL